MDQAQRHDQAAGVTSLTCASILRSILLLALAIMVFTHTPVRADDITSMRVGQHPDKTRLVLEVTGSPDFHVTLADQPKRLVVTLPAKDWHVETIPTMIPPFSAFDHVTENSVIRLTFDLSVPSIVRSAFMIAGEKDAPGRLVIDMVSATDAMFQDQVGRSYGTLSLTDRSTDAPSLTMDSKPKPVIVIDPGHGGKDSGAVSPQGINEKDITLSMAKTIVAVLNQTGRYDARLTRADDRFIPLAYRIKAAQQEKADVFLSLHADSVGDAKASGASVYTLSATASDEQAAKLATRENKADIFSDVDLSNEDRAVAALLIDLSMRETTERSKSLANDMIAAMHANNLETLKGAYRSAGFAVLKAPDIPSVLIETGFVSNTSEATLLLEKDYQNRMAKALVMALDQYFDTKSP